MLIRRDQFEVAKSIPLHVGLDQDRLSGIDRDTCRLDLGQGRKALVESGAILLFENDPKVEGAGDPAAHLLCVVLRGGGLGGERGCLQEGENKTGGKEEGAQDPDFALLADNRNCWRGAPGICGSYGRYVGLTSVAEGLGSGGLRMREAATGHRLGQVIVVGCNAVRNILQPRGLNEIPHQLARSWDIGCGGSSWPESDPALSGYSARRQGNRTAQTRDHNNVLAPKVKSGRLRGCR